MKRWTAPLALLLALPGLAQTTYDVQHYKLDLKVDPTARTVAGTVEMTAKSLAAGLAAIDLDLLANMAVSAVRVGAAPAVFTRPTDRIHVTLDRSYNLDEAFAVAVDYSGTPQSGGWGSFGFDLHNGQPIVWSLSQPWYGRCWWPNKDALGDKSTAEIWLTVPDTLYAVSNGKLMGIDPVTAGWARYRWQVHYPIIPYLISLAVSNYQIRTDMFAWGGKQLPMNFYIYPESYSGAQSQINYFKDMMQVYCSSFGEYPWMTGTIEKVGIAQFPWGGGMEHQTVASQGGFDVWLSAHELAHQWWGDCITCRTWSDIWLNEGFATWCEARYDEAKPGGTMAGYRSTMNSNRPSTLSGSVYCYNPTSVSAVFSGTNSYNKGSWVVHQLRGVLGDTDFFRCLAEYWKVYFGDSATTEDFRILCERVTGRDLRWFFQQCVYEKGGPAYRMGWKAVKRGGQDYLDLSLEQTQGASPNYWKLFTFPVELQINTTAGQERVKVWNSSWLQSYSIPVKGAPTGVTLDPDNWILKQSVNTTSYNPMLTLSAAALSAAQGGQVTLALNAGAQAATRPYLVLLSLSGMTPGTQLPGGNLLPLNLDALTTLGILGVNSPTLQNFFGNLDAAGRASALLNVAPGLLTYVAGQSLTFAFLSVDNFGVVSNGDMLLINP